MNEINRERFEAWLFSQPKERSFIYGDICGCAVASFLKECTSIQDPTVSSDTFRSRADVLLPDAGRKPLPEWLHNQVLRVRPLTIAKMQARYLELFPQTEIEAAAVEASKAPALTA